MHGFPKQTFASIEIRERNSCLLIPLFMRGPPFPANGLPRRRRGFRVATEPEVRRVAIGAAIGRCFQFETSLYRRIEPVMCACG